MKRVKTLAGLALGCFLAVPAHAQAPPSEHFETWLLPVSEEGRPGAFGTVWATTAWLGFQSSDPFEYIDVGPFTICESICGPVQAISPGPPIQPPISRSGPTDPPGQLFWVQRSAADRVWLKLRVQDLARTSPTRVGVEIPVVREKNLFTSGHIWLLNIPLDPQFRQWLRIYDVDRRANVAFRVVGRRQETGEQLFDTTITTTVQADKSWTPGAVSLDLRALLPIEASTTAYLEIWPTTENIRFWSFATVTSNETQEIVTVTP